MFKKQPPLYAKYAKVNQDVIGINYDLLNEDRKQSRKEPVELKTQRVNELTGEIE